MAPTPFTAKLPARPHEALRAFRVDSRQSPTDDRIVGGPG